MTSNNEQSVRIIDPQTAVPALYFLVAPVFALTTWQALWPGGLFYALPVVAFEIAIIVVAIVGGLSLIASIVETDKIAFVASSVWILSASVSTLLASHDPAQAYFRHYITIASFLFAFMLYSMLAKDWADEKEKILPALAWGCVLYTCILVVMVMAVSNTQSFGWRLVGAGATNFRQLGFYGLTLAGIGAGTFATSIKFDRSFGSSAFLFCGLFVVFWSGGRAAFGGLILSLLAAYFLGLHENRKQLLLRLSIFAPIAALLSEILAPIDSMGFIRIISRSIELGEGFTSARWDIWIAVLDAMSGHWFFGFGEGQFRSSIEESHGWMNHPHNFVLQFIYQWGLVGTFALAVLTIRLLLRAKPYILTERPTRLPAFATLLGLTGMATLEGSFFHTFPVMVALTCFVLIIVPSIAHERSRTESVLA